MPACFGDGSRDLRARHHQDDRQQVALRPRRRHGLGQRRVGAGRIRHDQGSPRQPNPNDPLRRRAVRLADCQGSRAAGPLRRGPYRAGADQGGIDPPGNPAGCRVLQGPGHRQTGVGWDRGNQNRRHQPPDQNHQRRPYDEGLRRRQPQELPLLRGLGNRGRSAGRHPPVRRGHGILRPAGEGPLARLQDAGGRGLGPGIARTTEDRRSPGRLRQGARHRRRGGRSPAATPGRHRRQGRRAGRARRNPTTPSN